MAVTGATTDGKTRLLQAGWTNKVNYAALYTSGDEVVDRQTIVWTHTTATATMQPSADIVFDVDAGTTGVSYVVIGNLTTVAELDVYTPYYTKVLSSTYDFTNDGTLTIDSFDITVAGSSLNADGIDALITSGLDQIVTAKAMSPIFTVGDTQTVSFSVASGVMSLDSTTVFDIDGITVAHIYLYDSTPTLLYTRQLDTPLFFETPGTVTIDSWEITI